MRYKYQSTMKDGNGKVIAGGTVSIFLGGSDTPASVYSASTGGSAVSSVVSDDGGYFYFWVDDADYLPRQTYRLVLSKDGFLSREYDDLIIFMTSDAVGVSGDEEISGVKTFTSSPIVPTPTTDMQASTKKYVDDSISDLGTASTKDTGTGIGNVVELSDVGGSAGLPAVDGTQLTGVMQKSLLTAAGDMIYASAANTPAIRAKGADGQVATMVSGLPNWAWSKIVQVQRTEYVSSGSTIVAIPWDDTIPQNTEGEEFFTVSNTAKDAANILDIIVLAHVASSTNAQLSGAIFKDSVVNAVSAGSVYASSAGQSFQLVFEKSIVAGSTSAQTFKVRFGPTSGTMYVNSTSAGRKFGGVLVSSITVIERTP